MATCRVYSMSLCAALLVLAAAPLCAAQPVVTPVDPFSAVSICVPYNVLIAPSNDSRTYSLAIESEPVVAQSTRASGVNGTLSLESSGNFQTSKPIKLTIFLPGNALNGITVNSPSSTVGVAAGFGSKQLIINSNGNGQVNLASFNASTAFVTNTGTGTVVLRGELGNVNVQNSGTGNVYLSGVTGNVQSALSGVGSLYIDSSNADSQLTGSSNGLGAVRYTKGQCSVAGAFGSFFGGPCQQVASIQAPPTSTPWSCGINVAGSFLCSGATGIINTGGSSTNVGGSTPSQLQSINFNPAGGVSSSSSSTGVNSAFASSSSGGGVGQTSTSSDGSGFTTTSGTPGTPGSSIVGNSALPQVACASTGGSDLTMIK
ncbi:hypothetical protein WJX74_000285 [Apatococcus lobatus]|uniref:Putative auto-transporter adhesin head GIN domain-containing protein n=1 Tax=Apatococcus lobatus TaxID=904363 RepID=A0AAW1RES6_9CHLO